MIRQHDQLVQRAQELASAIEVLATSMGEDETAIPAPTACELLTKSDEHTHDAAQNHGGAPLSTGGILLQHEKQSDGRRLGHGETRDLPESALAAEATILSSAMSLELAERCPSRARNAISGKVYERVSGRGLNDVGSQG